MLSRAIFAILIFLSAFVESTILPFPFVFALSTILFIFFEGELSLLIILSGALILDSLMLNHMGYTPLIMFSFFFIILLLENIFSNRNSFFLGISLICGVFMYMYFSNYQFSLILSLLLIAAVIGFIFFERRGINAA